MVYLKENPVGIDYIIDKIQKSIHDNLQSDWGQIDVYGRVHKITDSDGTIRLRRYIGQNEYEPILFSEGNKIFFVQGNSPKIEMGVAENDLYVISILKLEDGKFQIDDEIVHQKMVTELVNVFEIEDVSGLKYGMANIKRIVEDPFEKGNFKFSDIYPYHVFAVECKVKYVLQDNKC